MASTPEILCLIITILTAMFAWHLMHIVPKQNQSDYHGVLCNTTIGWNTPNDKSLNDGTKYVVQSETDASVTWALWENAITSENAEFMRKWIDAFLENAASNSQGNTYWNDKVAYITRSSPARVQMITNFIAYSASFHMQEMYNTGAIYPSTILVARMGPGQGVEWHADNAYYPNCTGPHYSDFRTHSSVTYLSDYNTDFTGGEFQFENCGITVEPYIGRTLLFGAGCDFYHRALPVKTGTRYTIAVWYTDNPKHTVWAN